MADMTMGQRIAERRKLLGLSQEGLGEKLGVSRQAISKWESDGAVPEIDKLISLSKLFGVSVGWLLGTEEETGGDSADGELTEKQIKMVEEIVRRYQPPAPQERPRKHWPVILACGALLIGAIWMISYARETRSLVDDYRWELNQLKSNYSNIEYQMSQLSNQLDQLVSAAEEQNEILAEYSFQISAMADSNNGSIMFSGIPKSWQAEDTVSISVRLGGRTTTTVPCAWDGTAYTAQFTLPPENGYEIYYLVGHADGTQEQHRLTWPDVENLARYMSVSCKAGSGGYELDFESGSLTLRDVPLSVRMPDSLTRLEFDQVTWTQCDFVLYKNGQEVDRVSPPGLLTGSEDSTEMHASIETLELSFGSLGEGEYLELWLEVELSNGQTGRAYANGWGLQDGEIIGYAMAEADY